MPDGTYADEPADADVIDRTVNSVKKIVSGLARLPAPHSVTDRQASIDDQVSQSVGGDSKVGRMKQAQSTDRDNSYSY